MIYKIFCNLNGEFVSDKISHGAQYLFFYYKRDPYFKTDLEMCNYITTKSGKTYVTRKGAENLCSALNKIINVFEVKEYILGENK